MTGAMTDAGEQQYMILVSACNEPEKGAETPSKHFAAAKI